MGSMIFKFYNLELVGHAPFLTPLHSVHVVFFFTEADCLSEVLMSACLTARERSREADVERRGESWLLAVTAGAL